MKFVAEHAKTGASWRKQHNVAGGSDVTGCRNRSLKVVEWSAHVD
jgi:hypothetical protein